VVAYGRSFVGRGAHTVNVVPAEAEFVPVDVACWGATLVSRPGTTGFRARVGTHGAVTRLG